MREGGFTERRFAGASEVEQRIDRAYTRPVALMTPARGLLVGSVLAAFAFALLIAASPSPRPFVTPMRTPSNESTHAAKRAIVEEWFHGIHPSRLILYAPPGFTSPLAPHLPQPR